MRWDGLMVFLTLIGLGIYTWPFPGALIIAGIAYFVWKYC